MLGVGKNGQILLVKYREKYLINKLKRIYDYDINK
jgi:hypothetical protein